MKYNQSAALRKSHNAKHPSLERKQFEEEQKGKINHQYQHILMSMHQYTSSTVQMIQMPMMKQVQQ